MSIRLGCLSACRLPAVKLPMPKKKPSQRKTTPAPRGATSSLALSSLHQRLNVLREEHQWLLKQIQRKRTELSNFLEQMRAVGTEIFHRGAPVFSQFVTLDREIHELFAEILSRKFGKQTRKKIVGIYQSLQMTGLISPKQELEDPEMEELD
ncbi:MAG: hypothetical protein HC890_09665, partial [Chloroflexaceae bacterium]|nr:hypothetical protein [Chloroflexaceae bacterium]